MREKNKMSHDHSKKLKAKYLYAKNLQELADAIGVSLLEIKEWKSYRGFPLPKSDGRWEIDKIRKWAAGLDFVDELYSEFNGMIYEQLLYSEQNGSNENLKALAKALNKTIKETQEISWNISLEQVKAYARLCTESDYVDVQDFGEYLISEYFFSFYDIEKLVEFLRTFKKLPHKTPQVLSYISDILKSDEKDR
jgi:hypothetical protein